MTTINQYAEMITAQKKLIKDKNVKAIVDLIPSIELAEKGVTYLNLAVTKTKEGYIHASTTTSLCCDLADNIGGKNLDATTKFRLGYSIIYPLIKKNKISSDNKYDAIEKNDRSKLFSKYHYLKSGSKGKSKVANKVIRVVDEAFIDDLLTYGKDISKIKPEAAIFTTPPEDWDGFYNNDLGDLINHCNRKVRRMFRRDKHQKLWTVLNKLQHNGMDVNSPVLRAVLAKEDDLYGYSINDEAREYIYKDENVSKKSLEGKLRMNDLIINNAIQAEGRTFYSGVKPESRGRLNYCLPGLNPSGPDLGKGLIRHPEGKVLGVKGWNALCISTINHFGDDKLSKDAKLDKFWDIYEDIMLIGENPIKNDAWMKWDNPVQGLAHCIEIYNAVMSGDEYGFVSKIYTGADASSSGPMLMGLSAQDYETMLCTNNIKGQDRQDIYLKVGFVVKRILNSVLDLPNEALGEPEMDNLFQEALWLVRNERDVIGNSLVIFNKLIEDDKVLRSWMKTPVMIIGYSAEEWCIAEAIWDEFYAKMPWLTPPFCKYLADVIYESYGKALPSCIQFMEGSKKLAGWIHSTDKHLLVNTQWDHFPLMHNYFVKESVDVTVPDKNNKSGQATYVVENHTNKLSYSDSVSGIGANLIHGCGDAVLLRKTVYDLDFPMLVNHDGFYCLAADYDEMVETLQINTELMATEYNLITNLMDQYSELEVESKIKIERIVKKIDSPNYGKKYISYSKAKDSDGKTIKSKATTEMMGIKINTLHPDFQPINNEFNYA